MKRITLTWNEPKNRWDMSHWVEAENQYCFIMDFPNCENILKFFRPHKDRLNHYEMEIRKVDEFNSIFTR